MNAAADTHTTATTLDEGDLADLDVATHLAELRHAVKRSQADLAEQLGITQPSVASIEKSNDPYVSTIQRYVAAPRSPGRIGRDLPRSHQDHPSRSKPSTSGFVEIECQTA